MATNMAENIKQIFTFRWKPSRDLLAVGISWLLVVGALYTATVLVGEGVWGGFAYFLLYAVLCATLFGVGLPLYWTVIKRRRPVADLGITTHRLVPSLVLQAVFSVLLYAVTLAKVRLPPVEEVIPLVALALTIGFSRQFSGAAGSLLWDDTCYPDQFRAVCPVPYWLSMPMNEIGFLFFIGILFAVVFLLTRNIFILWPVFQPMGQLVTLIRDELSLPVLAALGFVEVLVVMFVLVYLAQRAYKKYLKSIEPSGERTNP